MMYNDSINELDRYRVLNLYIIPALVDKKIFLELTEQKNIILFTYQFDNDIFNYRGIYDRKELKNQLQKANLQEDDDGDIQEFDNSHYEYFKKQFDLTEHSKFYICVFHYAPRGSFHPSLYSFQKSAIDQWHTVLTFGQPDETSTYNRWFSNQTIKEMVNWEILGNMQSISDHQCTVLIMDSCKDTNQFGTIDINDYLKACQKALVPIDMQKLIEDESKKGNLLIINVINYLRDYFLLVNVKKNTDNKHIFTFIPSPNDHSLNLDEMTMTFPL